MKKTNSLFYIPARLLCIASLFLISTNSSASFTYNISFTGSGATLGEVTVNNLTKGTTVTVPAGNTLSLTNLPTGVETLNTDNESVSIYPNPIQSSATFTFTAVNDGSTQINAFALDGEKILAFTTNLHKGSNSFQLALPAGVYMLQVQGNGYRYTAKAMSRATTTRTPQISFAGIASETKPEKVKTSTSGITTMTYDLGDQLLYNAKSGIYSAVMYDSPTTDESVNFQFTTNAYSIPTVLLPAGTFTMGSPLSEVGRGLTEAQYTVTLSAFRMSKYEITNAQYAAFLNAKSIGSDGKYAAGAYPTQKLISFSSSGIYDFGLHYTAGQWVPATGFENYPVINVSWYGASEYATYVGGTLPTEAQWEYACRAGTTTPLNTGAFLTDLQGNYNWGFPYNGGVNTVSIYPGKTQMVGSYAGNAWGLHDMHGNVGEWCADWYDSYPATAQTNPTGPATGGARMVRGGSFNSTAQDCRSACRYNRSPIIIAVFFGFRVAFVQ